MYVRRIGPSKSKHPGEPPPFVAGKKYELYSIGRHTSLKTFYLIVLGGDDLFHFLPLNEFTVPSEYREEIWGRMQQLSEAVANGY